MDQWLRDNMQAVMGVIGGLSLIAVILMFVWYFMVKRAVDKKRRTAIN